MVVYQNPVKVSADNITAGPLSRTTGHLHVQAPRGIMIAALPIRVSVVRGLAKCFEYLEARFTGECDSQYDYSAQLKMFAAVRAFDPAFAREKGESFLAPALVDELKKCVPLLAPLATGMKQELPQFSVAVRDITVNRADIPAFTKTVKGRAEELPSWAAAARIGFAMAQSSAACERVFSLLIPCSRSSSGVPP
mmetsp:Transcript_22029/g.59416  ORF Transcript_22029/g.59416 Transcript_22029/m.59416 type:complete len:194 (+) Transcript_22029:267-848(+)